MNIKVINYENKEELLEFKVRKNCKSIVENIQKQLESKYNCSIRNILPQGKIDLATGVKDIQYILFGADLPCRIIEYSML